MVPIRVKRRSGLRDPQNPPHNDFKRVRLTETPKQKQTNTFFNPDYDFFNFTFSNPEYLSPGSPGSLDGKGATSPSELHCPYSTCAYEGVDPNILIIHLQDHIMKLEESREKKDVFGCDYGGCEYESERKDHVVRHKGVHLPSADKPFHCTEVGCDFATTNSYYLTRHKEHHEQHIFDCPHCGFKLENFAQFEEHLNTHSSTELSCTYFRCHEVLDSNLEYLIHFSTHFTDNYHLKCPIEGCHYSSAREISLLKHIDTHNSTISLHCPDGTCEYSVPSKPLMVTHLADHFKYDHKCTFPDCTFESNDSLVLAEHRLIHEQLYTCHYDNCHFSAQHPSQLKIHLLTHTDEKPFKCTVDNCTYSTNRKFNLVIHSKIHEKRKNMN